MTLENGCVYMSQESNIQKKSNSKVLVFALIAICVILAGSLVGVIAIYQPIDSQLAAKNTTISSLQSQILNLESELASQSNSSTTQAYINQITLLNQELASLNDSYTAAQSDAYYFQSILQLQQSGTLYSNSITQDANTTTTIWNDQLDYAGYVIVQATSTANTTYAEVIYNYTGANFDYAQTIGTSGSAVFPVLPGIVQVNIGNINQTDTNTITVTATYFY
jgi:cell division protein FtsL